LTRSKIGGKILNYTINAWREIMGTKKILNDFWKHLINNVRDETIE
jgi:hypothetical protein